VVAYFFGHPVGQRHIIISQRLVV